MAIGNVSLMVKKTIYLSIYLSNYLSITRCTRGDARSFFCTHKTYLYAQNEISYEYIQILF